MLEFPVYVNYEKDPVGYAKSGNGKLNLDVDVDVISVELLRKKQCPLCGMFHRRLWNRSDCEYIFVCINCLLDVLDSEMYMDWLIVYRPKQRRFKSER